MEEILYHIVLIIPSTVEGLNECLDKVSCIGKKFSFNFEQNFALHTVMVEALENAFIHGNKGIRDLNVKVFISVTNLHIEIVIEDQGDGFNLDKDASSFGQFSLFRESGRGIFFIKSLSSDFKTLGKGNIVQIIINR